MSSVVAEASFHQQVERSVSRLLHFGIAYGDLRRSAESGAWGGMSQALACRGDQLNTLARRAKLRGSLCTARDAWLQAASYYHYASFKLGAGERKTALRRLCQDAYARAAGLQEPPAWRFEFDFAGFRFPGYLRSAGPGSPCVLLVNGLDSVKEVELARFAEGFLARGCSTYCFDGPGQGEGQVHPVPMSRFPQAVTAVLDALEEETGGGPFGIFGVSFGGYLACASAASDRRLAACVSLGGFHDGRIVHRLPPTAHDNLRAAFGLGPDTPLKALEELITLSRSDGAMDRPLLVVHGGRDHLVDREQVHLMGRWARGVHRTLLFEEAEHVCTDYFPEALPALWDWMKDALDGGAEAAEVVS